MSILPFIHTGCYVIACVPFHFNWFCLSFHCVCSVLCSFSHFQTTMRVWLCVFSFAYLLSTCPLALSLVGLFNVCVCRTFAMHKREFVGRSVILMSQPIISYISLYTLLFCTDLSTRQLVNIIEWTNKMFAFKIAPFFSLFFAILIQQIIILLFLLQSEQFPIE